MNQSEPRTREKVKVKKETGKTKTNKKRAYWVNRHDNPEPRPLRLRRRLPLQPLPALLVDLLLEGRVAEVLGDFGAAGVDVLFFGFDRFFVSGCGGGGGGVRCWSREEVEEVELPQTTKEKLPCLFASFSLSLLPYLFPRAGLPALEDLLLDPELLFFLEALFSRGFRLLAEAEESSSRERR